MPSWYAKAALQGALSLLPQHRRWNYYLQRYVTRNLTLDEKLFEGRVSYASQYLQYYQQYYPERGKPSTVIDLGTGWHPIIPVSLALCGVNRVISIDIEPLFYRNLIEEMLLRFKQYAAEGKLEQCLPQLDKTRLSLLDEALNLLDIEPLFNCLAPLNIEIMIADASNISLASKSVDYFMSTYALEHIPGDVIRKIFEEFSRLASDRTLMAHLIDLKDHYANFDSRITPYIFLKYSDRQWQWFNNRLQYLNRYRINDYRRVHVETGFEILAEENESGNLADIDSLSLDAHFASYASEDLLVSRSWIISKIKDYFN